MVTGIEKYIAMFFSTSIVMSAIVIALILFNKIFSSKYPAKWRYYIWLIVIVGFLIPFRPHINFNLNIELPYESVQAAAELDSLNLEFEELEVHDSYDLGYSKIINYSETDSQLNSNVEQKHIKLPELPVTMIIFAVWFAGAVTAIAINIRQHQSFMSIVRRWGINISDMRLLSLLHQAKAELGLSQKNIRFKMCRSITSPMLSGFFRPTIILPNKNIQDDELLFILKHELIHYKRGDLWINLLVAITAAVHWFNPFIYIMAGSVRSDCELSCDEAVLNGTGTENRRIYGEAIIGVISRGRTIKTIMSTNFYGGKNTMKKRIISIMNTSKKRVEIAILCGILVLSTTFLSGSVFAVDPPEAEKPTEAITSEETANKSPVIRAMEVAIEKAKGGIVLKYELDYEDSVKVYEFKIINGETIYEIDVCEDSSGKFVVCAYETEKAKKKDLELATTAIEYHIDTTINVISQYSETHDEREFIKYELKFNDGTMSAMYSLKYADGKISYMASELPIDSIESLEQEQPIKEDTKKDTQKKETKPMPIVAISYDDAVAIIIEKLNDKASTVKEWELDSEKDVWKYEFEVISDGKEYDIEINADTGEIIEFEIDD